MSFLARLFGGAMGGGGQAIRVAEYQERFVTGKQPHTLVDVRTTNEFRSGHIPHAINISVQELNAKMNKIPKDKPVIVYCLSGSRSGQAAHMLTAAGYSEVYDLGSVSNWTRQGLPLKR